MRSDSKRSKKSGNVLSTQPGIADPDAGHLQADQREAHRDAVIVVGLDFAAVQRGRLDLELIG